MIAKFCDDSVKTLSRALPLIPIKTKMNAGQKEVI